MNLAPVLLLATLAVAGCTGTAARDDLQEATTTTSNRTTSSTSSTTRSTTASTTATSTTGSSESTSSSTIHTDGGDVTVRARNGRLELVEIDAAEGWTGDHRVEHPGRLIVSFERQGGRVDVTVELTPTGIVTSTRSVSTG